MGVFRKIADRISGNYKFNIPLIGELEEIKNNPNMSIMDLLREVSVESISTFKIRICYQKFLNIKHISLCYSLYSITI